MIASVREKNVKNCILAVIALDVCHICPQSLSQENHMVMLDWKRQSYHVMESGEPWNTCVIHQ